MALRKPLLTVRLACVAELGWNFQASLYYVTRREIAKG